MTSSNENELKQSETPLTDLTQINTKNITNDKFVESSLNDDVNKKFNKTLETVIKIVDIQKVIKFYKK